VMFFIVQNALKIFAEKVFKP